MRENAPNEKECLDMSRNYRAAVNPMLQFDAFQRIIQSMFRCTACHFDNPLNGVYVAEIGNIFTVQLTVYSQYSDQDWLVTLADGSKFKAESLEDAVASAFWYDRSSDWHGHALSA